MWPTKVKRAIFIRWRRCGAALFALEFQLRAVVRRLSKHLKQKIGETIGPEYDSLLELLAARRAALPHTLKEQSQRAAFWRAVLSSEILNLLRAGQTEEAEKLLENFLTIDYRSHATN